MKWKPPELETGQLPFLFLLFYEVPWFVCRFFRWDERWTILCGFVPLIYALVYHICDRHARKVRERVYGTILEQKEEKP